MKQNTHKITDFLSLGVFALFALCLLLVLLFGARVYRDLTVAGAQRYETRTASAYLTTRVRQAESLTVEDFGGEDALVIREQIGNGTYLTRIYCHEGYLRELFCAESASLSPSDGEKVLEAECLALAVEDGILTAILDGNVLRLQLRNGREVLP